MQEHLDFKRGDRMVFIAAAEPRVRFKALRPTGAGYAFRDPRDGKEFYVGQWVLDCCCQKLIRLQGRKRRKQ